MVELRNKILLTSNNLSELELQETHLNAYGMIKGIKWRIQNRLKVWPLISTKIYLVQSQCSLKKRKQAWYLTCSQLRILLQWQSHFKGGLLMRRFEIQCSLTLVTRLLVQMDFLLGFSHRSWLVVQNEVVAAIKSFFANEF